jgi:hypothetical protein
MRKQLNLLTPGQVFGCWTVLREARADLGRRRRYLVRASCCGNEKVKRADDIMRAVPRCLHCKVGPRQKAVARG